MLRLAWILPIAAVLAAPPARADSSCRSVEVRFKPMGRPAEPMGREPLSPQIAVWVEDAAGKFIADVYVTRLVGLLGLGNRPGQALLKSDFRWPYGRRPMALPIWAYGRGKSYGFIVMGGSCSRKYNPDNPRDTTCPDDFTGDPSDDDRTVAYHGPVSSDEPFYCSPSGWRYQKMNGVDVVSCASSFFGSKGWYAPGYRSVYPPRADLMTLGGYDHPDVLRFRQDNDVAAVSGATPPTGRIIDPPIRWIPPSILPDGEYVLKVEVNIEADWNAFWRPGQPFPNDPNGRYVDEPHKEWNNLGKPFIGQPSILYRVPFLLSKEERVTTARDYAGYGDWKGESGKVHPPDATISQTGGSGADRLSVVSDENGDWRVKVGVISCDKLPCGAPVPPLDLDMSERTDTTITVGLRVPAGEAPGQFQVRYQVGVPITTEEEFLKALPAVSPPLDLPGKMVRTRIEGLVPNSRYFIAARSLNRCGVPSRLVTGEVITQAAKFTTLSGCFVATAAYGSPLALEVAVLRDLRDRVLLRSPLGQVFVASYYAVSPPLSGVIAESDHLRGLARQGLSPLLRLARTLLQ